MRAAHHISRDGGKDTHSYYQIKQKDLKNHKEGRHHKQSTANNIHSGQSLQNNEQIKQDCERDSSYQDQHNLHDISEDEKIFSRHEMHKEAKSLHQIIKRRKDPGGMSVKEVNAEPTSQGDRVVVTEAGMRVKRKEIDSNVSKTEKNLKHIILSPDHRSLSGNESSGVELCKKLFGITVFEYSNGKAQWNHISKDRKLVVQGVIEGSASYSSGRIHRGDMLVRVNDVNVSWSNFTSLLNSLNRRKKVKLTFQSPRIVGPKSSYSVLKVPENDLCFAVSGKRLADIQSELSSQACVALYLTLVNSSSDVESDEKEDVIYAFPPEEERLTALRGLFMTLSSALMDVVDQPASCSSLVLSNTLVNVAYKQIGSDVLVFAMPENRIPRTALAASLDSFCSLLVLLFSDVKSAFSNCDRNWLDRVLALMFYETLSLCSLSSSYKRMLAIKDYYTVKMLNLSHENKLICDEILSEFEAMDFDDYLDGQDLFSRRQYTVQGTSLYYKDHLLCSHVPSEQQRNINLFMNYHGLLSLSSRQHVDQVMVWQELKLCTPQDVSLLPAGYRPNYARSFLLIVSLNHYYLGALIEAGGCSQPAHVQVRPVSLLVDQGKATLAQLEAEDVHMSQYCEERSANTSKSMSIASADKLYRLSSARSSGREMSGSGRISESQKQTTMSTKPFSKSPFSRSKSVDRLDEKNDAGSGTVMRRQGSKLSYGSNDSTGSGSSTGPPKSKGSRVSSVVDLSGIFRSLSLLQIDVPHDATRERRLDRGKETAIFTYLHLDSSEGILICPTQAEMMEVHSSLQQQIIENFSQTCHKIRALFKKKVSNSDTNLSMFSTSAAGNDDDYNEVGTLFCCTLQPSLDKKRQMNTQHYWVVGRFWPGPRAQEMYVCFHESANQSLVEMAFTLGFGI